MLSQRCRKSTCCKSDCANDVVRGPQGVTGAPGSDGAQGAPGASGGGDTPVAAPVLIGFSSGPVSDDNTSFAPGVPRYYAHGLSSTTFDVVAFPVTRSGAVVRLQLDVSTLSSLPPGASLTFAVYRAAGFAGAPSPAVALTIASVAVAPVNTVITGSVPVSAGDRLALGVTIAGVAQPATIQLVMQAGVDIVLT